MAGKPEAVERLILRLLRRTTWEWIRVFPDNHLQVIHSDDPVPMPPARE